MLSHSNTNAAVVAIIIMLIIHFCSGPTMAAQANTTSSDDH